MVKQLGCIKENAFEARAPDCLKVSQFLSEPCLGAGALKHPEAAVVRESPLPR